MNWEAVTDWADVVAVVLLAVGIGAVAGGLVTLGPVIVGVGVWVLVTGLALGGGSALVQWHTMSKRRDRPGVGGG